MLSSRVTAQLLCAPGPAGVAGGRQAVMARRARSFASKLRSIVTLSRSAKSKLADDVANNDEDEDDDDDEVGVAEDVVGDGVSEEKHEEAFASVVPHDDDDESVVQSFLGSSESRLMDVLELAVYRLFHVNETEDRLFTAGHAVGTRGAADKNEKPAGPPPPAAMDPVPSKLSRHDSNPFYYMASTLGSAMDMNIPVLLRKDVLAGIKALGMSGTMPERVARTSPLARSGQLKDATGDTAIAGGEAGRGIWNTSYGPSVRQQSQRKLPPACWGLAHNVVAMDRARINILRNTLEAAKGVSDVLSFSQDKESLSPASMGALSEGLIVEEEDYKMQGLLSVQRTCLGAFPIKLNMKSVGDNCLRRMEMLTNILPPVVALQEDVNVEGRLLNTALTVFIYRLVGQFRSLLDAECHVAEGLYITEEPIHAATFSDGQFEDSAVQSTRDAGMSKGIKLDLAEIVNEVEEAGDGNEDDASSNLVLVKALKRAVLQHKALTLSFILTVDMSEEGGTHTQLRQPPKFPHRYVRVFKRFVFHHSESTVPQSSLETPADVTQHYSGMPFEALYGGVFLNQQAARKYLTLFSNSPMDAAFFEPYLAKKKETIVRCLSSGDVPSTLLEMLSFSLLEWSQEAHNNGSMFDAELLQSDLVEAYKARPKKDAQDSGKLAMLPELVLLDSSIACQILSMAKSVDLFADVIRFDSLASDAESSAASGKAGNSLSQMKEDIQKKDGEMHAVKVYLSQIAWIINYLESMEKCGISEVATSSEYLAHLKDILRRAIIPLQGNAKRITYLLDELYGISHAMKSCANVLLSGMLCELVSSTKEIAAVKQEEKDRVDLGKKGSKIADKQTTNRAPKDATEESRALSKRPPDEAEEGRDRSFPTVLAAMQSIEPSLLPMIDSVARAGIEVALGGIIWEVTQPPVALDPYPKSLRLMKAAGASLSIFLANAVSGPKDSDAMLADFRDRGNQLLMATTLDSAGSKNVASVLPVYAATDPVHDEPCVVFGSYAALQYCHMESVTAMAKVIRIQSNGEGGDEGGTPYAANADALWNMEKVRTLHTGTCAIDVVQALDGAMTLQKLSSTHTTNGMRTGRAPLSSNLGMHVVNEYYLATALTDDAREMEDAVTAFALDVIMWISSSSNNEQSHVLKDASRKGKVTALVLDIEINHVAFLQHKKERLLENILSSNFMQSATVQSESDPFRRNLQEAAMQILLERRDEPVIYVLIAQPHDEEGYVPLVKAVHLKYRSSKGGRPRRLPIEAHSQVFLDEASANVWHNWHAQESRGIPYMASCARLFEDSSALDKLQKYTFLKSLSSMESMSKAIDWMTGRRMDLLRACIAAQDVRGVAVMSKELCLPHHAFLIALCNKAMLMMAFLRGDSIAISELMHSDLHDTILERLLAVFKSMVADLTAVVAQDWAAPVGQPLKAFLSSREEIERKLKQGSFQIVLDHVRSVLFFCLECAAYLSAGVEACLRPEMNKVIEKLRGEE